MDAPDPKSLTLDCSANAWIINLIVEVYDNHLSLRCSHDASESSGAKGADLMETLAITWNDCLEMLVAQFGCLHDQGPSYV